MPIPSANNPGPDATPSQANIFLSPDAASEPLEPSASRATAHNTAPTLSRLLANRRATQRRGQKSLRTAAQRARPRSGIRLLRVGSAAAVIAIATALAVLLADEPVKPHAPAGSDANSGALEPTRRRQPARSGVSPGAASSSPASPSIRAVAR